MASLRQVGPEELRPVETMVCGGMAGVCFWTCIFPLDVIKSRIQVTQLCSMCLYGVLFMLYDLKFDLPQRSLGLPFEAKQDISIYILHESDACCILLLLEDVLMFS